MADQHGASRRAFIRTGAMGAAAAAWSAACGGPAANPPAESGAAPATHRVLGRTGLRLPAVSMGTAYAGDLVHAALDGGIRYLHTSSSYGERNHERLLGRALAGRPRDSFVIGTSPDLPYRLSPGGGFSLDVGLGVDPRLIESSMRDSLALLGLDHVDIYYLASANSRASVLHKPYITAYQQLKQAGLTRFIGVVCHSREPEVIRAAAASGAWDVVVTAYNFRQTHGAEIAAAMAEAARAGLGIIAMKTQAGVYWDRLRLRRINMKAALKWVLANEHVHTTIPAFANHAELREDLDVLRDPALTPAERADLGLGDRAGLSGTFCQQCGSCVAQCPSGQPVPTLMRAAMYAYGHGRMDRAVAAWRAAGAPRPPCLDCGACDVRCALGLDIRGTILGLGHDLRSV